MEGEKDEGSGFLFGIQPSLLELIPSTDPEELRLRHGRQLIWKHYSALGKVASDWAYFEFSINAALCRHSGLSFEVGACFTAQLMGPRGRMDAYISLVSHLGASKKWNNVLDQFSKDAISLGEQRNRVLHDIWGLENPENPRRLESTARKKLVYRYVQVSTNDVLNLAESIVSLTMRFEQDIDEPISDELRASHGMPPLGR